MSRAGATAMRAMNAHELLVQTVETHGLVEAARGLHHADSLKRVDLAYQAKFAKMRADPIHSECKDKR